MCLTFAFPNLQDGDFDEIYWKIKEYAGVNKCACMIFSNDRVFIIPNINSIATDDEWNSALGEMMKTCYSSQEMRFLREFAMDRSILKKSSHLHNHIQFNILNACSEKWNFDYPYIVNYLSNRTQAHIDFILYTTDDVESVDEIWSVDENEICEKMIAYLIFKFDERNKGQPEMSA